MKMLSKEILEKQKAIHTATEIYQQPEVWQELIQSYVNSSDQINKFLESIYTKHEQVRVIFAGAGSSAFVGDTVVPALNKNKPAHVQFEAIATTDIVSNPTEYLYQEVPTIMVSFARSGNSPESVATVALGKQLISNFYQVVITCNKDGQLAENVKNDKNAITFLTPERAHDQALAMTSSFSCMLLASFLIFTRQHEDTYHLESLVKNGELLLKDVANQVDSILDFDFNRVVYLGSGLLGQISHEAALKMLELTAGKMASMYESSLGFRHGPKSFLDNKSIVLLSMSQDSYTRKYDIDILREIAADASLAKVVVLTDKVNDEIEELADWAIPVTFNDNKIENDIYLALLYVMVAQIMALKKSLQLGITPDTPSATGQINRVVQGVTIHSYNK